METPQTMRSTSRNYGPKLVLRTPSCFGALFFRGAAEGAPEGSRKSRRIGKIILDKQGKLCYTMIRDVRGKKPERHMAV